MNQQSKPHQPLPNVHQAEIDPRKFEQYSLNPDNPNNQGKAIAFMTIGYDVNSPQSRHLAAKILLSNCGLNFPIYLLPKKNLVFMVLNLKFKSPFKDLMDRKEH